MMWVSVEVEDFSCSLLASDSILSRATFFGERVGAPRCASSSFHLDFDLFTTRRQQGVNTAGSSGTEKAVDSLPSGAFTQIVHQPEFKKKDSKNYAFIYNFCIISLNCFLKRV